jgi:NAD(P)H-flavin reductase
LFWGLKNYKDIYLLEELKQSSSIHHLSSFKICLSREENLNMIPEEDKKYFAIGHVDSCFEKLIPSPYSLNPSFEFYLCGGRNVVESLKQSLLSKNIPAENIIFEKF